MLEDSGLVRCHVGALFIHHSSAVRSVGAAALIEPEFDLASGRIRIPLAVEAKALNRNSVRHGERNRWKEKGEQTAGDERSNVFVHGMGLRMCRARHLKMPSDQSSTSRPQGALAVRWTFRIVIVSSNRISFLNCASV